METSIPGARTPPTYAPSGETTSKFMDVPKSATIAGAPKSSFAATALTIRSGPTSRGASCSIGIPVRTPGPMTRSSAFAQRSATCSYSGTSRGTVEERQIPSIAPRSRKSASSAPSSSPVRCASVAIRQRSPSSSPS